MSDITVTANPIPTNDAGGITGAPFNQHDPQPSALQENEDQYYNGDTYLPGTDDLDEAVFDNLLFHEGSITHMYTDTQVKAFRGRRRCCRFVFLVLQETGNRFPHRLRTLWLLQVSSL